MIRRSEVTRPLHDYFERPPGFVFHERRKRLLRDGGNFELFCDERSVDQTGGALRNAALRLFGNHHPRAAWRLLKMRFATFPTPSAIPSKQIPISAFCACWRARDAPLTWFPGENWSECWSPTAARRKRSCSPAWENLATR